MKNTKEGGTQMLSERIKSFQKNHIPKHFKSQGYVKGVYLSIERSRYFTESWKTTDGEPLSLRKAKAIANYFKNCTLFIRPEELIVGYFAESAKALTVTLDTFSTKGVESYVKEGFVKKTMAKIRGLFMPILRFILRPFITDLRNLIIELHNKNKREIHNLKPLKPIVFQSKEYIKLLHNCANNTIVELSKLKVEEEMLKTKIRILEDRIELLEKRERALEKQVFN